MRISELRSQIESEVRGVVDERVSELNGQTSALLQDSFIQQCID